MSKIVRTKQAGAAWGTSIEPEGGDSGSGLDPLLPSLGLLAETMPEWACTGGNTLTQKIGQGGLVWLEAGVPVTGLIFPLSDVGVPSAGSRMYALLYSTAGDLLAQSIDLAHNGWASAPGAYPAAFDAPYTPPATGPYYAFALEQGSFGGGEPLWQFPSSGAHVDYAVPGALPRCAIFDNSGGSNVAPPPASTTIVGDDSYLRLGVY